MINQLSHLVALEQISDQRRAAERYHLAAATEAANGTRHSRTIKLPSLRTNRSLVGQRKRPNLA